MFPELEKLARALSTQFGGDRRFPMDSNDPWVARSHFDGGAIQYVLASTETSPYPWAAPEVWRLGALHTRSSRPKLVRIDLPRAATVYDAFEMSIVQPDVHGDTISLRTDLRTFPGKLYALAPHELLAPQLSARSDGRVVRYSIRVGLPARVPLQLTLTDRNGTVASWFRGSNAAGELTFELPVPAQRDATELHVTELLGGKTSAVSVPSEPLGEPPLHELPTVDVEREASILQLFRVALKAGLYVSPGTPGQARSALLQALRAKGVRSVVEATAGAARSGVHLVFAIASQKPVPELLGLANQRGLLTRRLGLQYPGPGRGFLGTAFAARSFGENAILVVGGDQTGLDRAMGRLAELLRSSPSTRADTISRSVTPHAAVTYAGDVRDSAATPKLSDRIGVRLTAVRAVGNNIVVSAKGYQGNLAHIADNGDSARILDSHRVAESSDNSSLYLSEDGQKYGLAARTTQRHGAAFSMFRTRGSTFDTFASFGDSAPLQQAFAASADAATVLAPGPYGVVAWRASASGWKEAWAIDYWKEFGSLDWPVAANMARIPSFSTLIPSHGKSALITFGEFANNGWTQNLAASKSTVSARSLETGRMEWSFDVPISGSITFPTLFANAPGSLALLQSQVGVGGRASYQYFALRGGHALGTWTTTAPTLQAQIADIGNRIAIAFSNGTRLLEVRSADGAVVYSITWPSQPLAIAFAQDGKSLFVSDEAGLLTGLDGAGEIRWQSVLGCSAALTSEGDRLYAAGWDGRLRAFDTNGRARWSIDLTSSLLDAQAAPDSALHEPARRAIPSPMAPPSGPNLLTTGQAKLSVGGTPGWKSYGRVEVSSKDLTNGIPDDVDKPWLGPAELYWDATAQRKVWAEIEFAQPTDVRALTVHENKNFPDSWPTETVVQVWEGPSARWRTVEHGLFLHAASTTYSLELKQVKRLRYVPWSDYFRNFYTSEIEVR